MVPQLIPLMPLGKDEASYEPFTRIRSLEDGCGSFAENTSPSSENAKVERVEEP